MANFSNLSSKQAYSEKTHNEVKELEVQANTKEQNYKEEKDNGGEKKNTPQRQIRPEVVLNKEKALKLIILAEEKFYEIDNRIQNIIKSGVDDNQLSEVTALLDKAALTIDEANDFFEGKNFNSLQQKISEAIEDLNLAKARVLRISQKRKELTNDTKPPLPDNTK
ncbi:MAG: hypothetical protein V1872_14075 [bacterium]